MCDSPASSCGSIPTTPAPRKQVVFFASQYLGEGDLKLGEILMRNAIKTLSAMAPLPSSLLFMNSAVRLTTQDGNLLADLQAMESAGVELLSCGTCLDFYGLRDSLKAGRVSNMAEIFGRMASADLVIRI